MEQTIGPDKISFVGDRVVILSVRAMPDWTVREFCRRPILFRGTKYFLARKTSAEAPYAFCYELAPWVDDQRGEGNPIHYDDAYVQVREADARADRRHHILNAVLTPIFPFLGFVWSNCKHKHLWPCGFDVPSITSASILVGFSCFLLESIFVFYLGGGFLAAVFHFGPFLLVDYLLLLILPIDCVFRLAGVLDGEPVYYGFLEWLPGFFVRNR